MKASILDSRATKLKTRLYMQHLNFKSDQSYLDFISMNKEFRIKIPKRVLGRTFGYTL